METFHTELIIVAVAVALAPALAELPSAVRIPVVVLEILLGILIGPHVLELADPEGVIAPLSSLGLTFLLFLVGLEIDIGEIQGRPMLLAINGWLLSFSLAMGCTLLLHAVGLIHAPPVLAAVALSTTALGIVIPILKDKGTLDSNFGKYMLAAAAMGEFGPLVVISLILIPSHSTVVHSLFIVGFTVVAFLAAYVALVVRSSALIERLAHTMQSSGQLPVRLCIVLQALLVALAEKFGLNIVIGAFAAGMVVGLATKGEKGEILRQKLDAVGFGFLIPIFFITVGMRFDVSALWSGPLAPIQIIILLCLFVLIRGIPVLLYRNDLDRHEKLAFTFYSATGLPLIVVISELGLSSGVLSSDRAAVLVSAAMISVLLFPLLADRWRSDGRAAAK